MKARKLPCDLCGFNVSMRQTIKEGPKKGKKVCGVCKAKNTPKKVYKRSIKPITEKTRQKKTTRFNKLKVYFDYHIARCEQSEESGKPIHNPNRSNVAHLFPKNNHKSVEDCLENCVYLTLDEHTRFDNYLFSARFDKLEKEFKSWDMILDRFEALLPLVTENTKFKRNIEEYINKRKNGSN